MNGLDYIKSRFAERRLQASEKLDDLQTHGQLASAAACYAETPGGRMTGMGDLPVTWPFPPQDWHPGDDSLEGRIEELARAGALIAAEIDRLQREADG